MKKLRALTKEEKDALARVEVGYVRRTEDGELLIVDDSNYFRHQRELRAKQERDEAQQNR